MITVYRKAEQRIMRISTALQNGKVVFLRRQHLVSSKESSIFGGFRVSQTPK